MPSNDDHSKLQNLGTVMGAPENGLRYMRRRRIGTADRNGDPLDGIVNLFDVAIVLAVGFLVAALSAAGVSGLLTSENMTIVTNPGTPQMQVIVKEGDQITKLDMQSGAEVEGMGTLIGSFYKLADGTVVYVPAGETAPSGATPVPKRDAHARGDDSPGDACARGDADTRGDLAADHPAHDGGRSRRRPPRSPWRRTRADARAAGQPSERRSSMSRRSSAASLNPIWMEPPRLPLRIRTGASKTPYSSSASSV